MLEDPRSNLFKLFEAALLDGRGFPHQSSGMCRPSEASVQIQTKAGPLVIGSCNRKLWYRLNKAKVTEGDYLAHQIQRMNVGKEVENSVIETCKREGLFVDNNIPFRVVMDGVPVAGEMDLVLRTSPCSGKKYCMECKSIYGYYATKETFGKSLKMGGDAGKPKDSYLMQLALYLNYFSRLPKTDPSYLEFGALFICDRGDGHFGVFDVWLEEETRFITEDEPIKVHRILYSSDHMGVPKTVVPYTTEDILHRYRTGLAHIDKLDPPERDFVLEFDKEMVEMRHEQGKVSASAYSKWTKSHGPRGKAKEKLGDWQCGYCPYRSLCWELNT